ncbi:MAG: hypothetical protein JXR76_32725 [Deltaproteobacteria bacterium]|nr:hypothetical protein [Deltaproteobacteria bacterium]
MKWYKFTGMGFVYLFVAAVSCGCGDRHESNEKNFSVFATNPQVRSCDILLRSAGIRIARVDFSKKVLGSHQLREPRMALSYIHLEDESLGDAAASVVISQINSNSKPQQMSPLAVVSSSCFDREGNPVADGGVFITDNNSHSN